MRRLALFLVTAVLITVSHFACKENSNTITGTTVVSPPTPVPTPSPAYLVGGIEYLAARGSAAAKGVTVRVIQGNTTKIGGTDRFLGRFEIDGLVSGPATLEAGSGSCFAMAHLVLAPGKNGGGLLLPCYTPGY